MDRRLNLTLTLFLFPAILCAQVATPDTPAGHALAAWLSAFNSAERAGMDAFQRAYGPNDPESLVISPQFRGQSGGVTLLSIQQSQPLSISFRLQEKSQPTVIVGRIDMASAKPPVIRSFSLHPVPAGAVADDLHLDSAARKQVIEDVISNLSEFYVDPALAEKMATDLRARDQRGDYNAISDGEDLAAALTQHLLDVSHDKHLRLFYNPYKWTGDPGLLTNDQMIEARRAMARDCGFRRIEILPNNIGLVKIDFFADMMACGRTAAAAISFLANVDAVLFDLRDNGGGDPRMVAFLCTYLFDQPVHLNDLWDRKQDKTTEYWTFRYVPGTRIGRKPVYVLTSSRTFSGAEEFAYDLKQLKRATIVGETTGGGSHPVNAHRAGDHFIIYVPCARSINPISKTDWEQTGVVPDVAVSAASAVDKAAELAAGNIQDQTRNPNPDHNQDPNQNHTQPSPHPADSVSEAPNPLQPPNSAQSPNSLQPPNPLQP